MAKICPRCSAPNLDSANFCEECGSSLAYAKKTVLGFDAQNRTAPLDSNPRQVPNRRVGNIRQEPFHQPVKLEAWTRFFFYTCVISIILGLISFFFLVTGMISSVQNGDISSSIVGAGIGSFLFMVCMFLGILSYYLCFTLSTHLLAVKHRIKDAWLVWIPGAKNYILGQLVDDTMWGYTNASKVLCFGSLVVPVLFVINVFISVLSMASSSLSPDSFSLFSSLMGSLPMFLAYILYLVFYVYTLCVYYKIFVTNGVSPVIAVIGVITILPLPFLMYYASQNCGRSRTGTYL